MTAMNVESQTRVESPLHVDTLIIGAGAVGSSVAMHLAQRGRAVHVIDLDLEGALSSSELNAGGVRATFLQPLNIAMSQLTIDYFAQHSAELGYLPCGYLWLHREEGMKQARAASVLHRQAGWPVEEWSVQDLRAKIPWMDKTGDLVGAFFGPRDGLVNPNRVKNHFRELAREKGAIFEDRLWLRAARRLENTNHPWELRCEKFETVMSHESKLAVLTGDPSLQRRRGKLIRAKEVVNCSGAWAKKVAEILGYSVPVYPLRRQVCLFDTREIDLSHTGMMIDPSGVYFHPEATHALAGRALPEPPGMSYHYDGESFFEEQIWAPLYERATGFEKLRHITGWAGLYEVSPDESAVIGEVPGAQGLFEAHSFSGHGLMHSYAAGLVLSEKMVNGRYLTLDAEPFSAKRFFEDRLLRENMVI